jgi:hypothetical protein
MVYTLLNFSSLSLSLDTLGVSVQTARGFLLEEFWSVDGSLRLSAVQEVLSPIKVGTRGSLVILHNAVRSEKVVQHVSR